jgi:putative ABC transport system permease protein
MGHGDHLDGLGSARSGADPGLAQGRRSAEYPYYGKAELDPDMPLPRRLQMNSVVVADEFLIRLKAKVGDTLRLGGHNFRIAARLVQEPDRITAGAGIGPRVLISRARSTATTGLLSPGSRATNVCCCNCPQPCRPPRNWPQCASRSNHPARSAGDGLPRRQSGAHRGPGSRDRILSLICLVAMVLGAIGVAMSMHAHLEQRMDVLAILKAIGAGSGDLLRIFLLQTMGLGLAGAILGVAAGAGVMLALPAVFGNLLPVHATLAFPWRSALAGLRPAC